MTDNGFPDSDMDGISDACDTEFTIDALIDNMVTFIQNINLSQGQTNSLSRKLNDAMNKFCQGKVRQADRKLNAFIDQVQDLQADEILTSTEGQFLTSAAQALINAIISGMVVCLPPSPSMPPLVEADNGVLNLADYIRLEVFPNPASSKVNIHILGMEYITR